MITLYDSSPPTAVPYGRATFSAAVVVALLAVWRIVTVAQDHLAATYDLSYEGPQIRSIALFANGTNPYSADVYNDVPFTITFYPPLYPLLVSVLPLHSNVFVTGRVVSLFCMLVAGCCILVTGHRTAAWPILSCACFFLLWPVSTNSAFVKCDSMALAFAACSIAVLQSHQNAHRVVGAAFLAVMAMATKQSYISAGVSGFVFLLAEDRRRAVEYLATVILCAGSLAAAATASYGNGLWTAISIFSTNAVNMATAMDVLLAAMCQPLFVVLIGLALIAIVLQIKRKGAFRHAVTCLPALYAFCAFAVALLTLGKEGSSTNYLLEPALGVAMTLARRYGSAADVGWPVFKGFLAPLLLAGCAIWDTTACDQSSYNLCRLPVNKGGRDLVQQRRTAVTTLAGDSPAILNLAWASLTAELPGEVSLSDPFGQLLLYESSALEIHPLVASVDRAYYDIIVIYPQIADRFLSSGSPVGQLGDALRRRYRPAGLHCDVFCWIPARKPGHMPR